MKENQQLKEQPNGAVFRAADLHVHTPASQDMDKKWQSATAEQVVQHALANGIRIMAVTDHNTAAWCDEVRTAAEDTTLTVFPGVEITTSEGHLLALFDTDKPASQVEEFLIEIGIKKRDFGNLAAISALNMTALATKIEADGGIAIAAHVDGKKGFWRMMANSGVRRQQIHACPQIRAFEVVDGPQRDDFLRGRIDGYPRNVPCVQGSDCWPSGADSHQLDAIGHRHCMLKMDRVSIFGLRQALLDPYLHIRFMGDPIPTAPLVIEGLWVSGGFLGGQQLRFSDDMSCLIGGSGSGKSLTVELVRFALDQQVDAGVLPSIAEATAKLLAFALADYNTVYVMLRKGGDRYLVERTWVMGDAEPPTISRIVGEGVEPLDEPISISSFFRIKVFSQSEIIEYSREPLARLTLIDDLIDVDDYRREIEEAKAGLRRNAANLIQKHRVLAQEMERIVELPGIQEEIARLKKLFDHPLVKEQELWQKEKAALERAAEFLDEVVEVAKTEFPELASALIEGAEMWEGTPNKELVDQVETIGSEVKAALQESQQKLTKKLTGLKERLASVRGVWDSRFEAVEREIKRVLEEQDQAGRGLVALHQKLTRLRKSAQGLEDSQKEIEQKKQPEIDRLEQDRQDILVSLQEARSSISAKRRDKAAQLVQRLEKRVSINVHSGEDRREYKELLLDVRTGSRQRETDIDEIVRTIHSVRLVNALTARDFEALARDSGLSESVFERLIESISESDRLDDLYELQIVDLEDVIKIQFEIEDNTYRDLEALAHGMKCTVVLMIALAEGDFPLLVDQPEDALHAPWIEDNIVSSLRSRRGSRQFIFATRNANVLVSSDAEQVIALKADATRGWIDRTGAIDDFDTRDIVVYHLEGGKDAFLRRQQKYGLDLPEPA